MESSEITTGIWQKSSFEFKLDCLNIWTAQLPKWPWIGNDVNGLTKTTQNEPKRRKIRQNDANSRDLSLDPS